MIRSTLHKIGKNSEEREWTIERKHSRSRLAVSVTLTDDTVEEKRSTNIEKLTNDRTNDFVVSQ